MSDVVIMFYGKECPHCKVMMPLVDRLVKDEKVKIKKLEVWHSEENATAMRSYGPVIKTACGGFFGTPTFIKGERALCGECSYEELKKWATQK